MSEPHLLPTWADDLRRRYLRGEASMFVLHGNVYDVVLCQKRMMALTERERAEMGRNAREVFLREFAMAPLLARHEKLMGELLGPSIPQP